MHHMRQQNPTRTRGRRHGSSHVEEDRGRLSLTARGSQSQVRNGDLRKPRQGLHRGMDQDCCYLQPVTRSVDAGKSCVTTNHPFDITTSKRVGQSSLRRPGLIYSSSMTMKPLPKCNRWKRQTGKALMRGVIQPSVG